MALILFLSINVISANEINDNDLNSIDSTDAFGIDSVENTEDLSSELNEDQEEEDSQSDILSESQSNDNIGESSSAEPIVTDDGSADSDDLINPSLEASKVNTSISQTIFSYYFIERL